MDLFKGLYIGEIILMVLGAVLCLVLIYLLVFLIMKKRSYKQMIVFFLLPVLMIGFPSIKKIKYDNGIVEIEKETRQVENNPQDAAAKQALAVKIQALQPRTLNDPKALEIMARANLSIGDTVKAREAVKSALRINPSLVPAQRLSRKISGD